MTLRKFSLMGLVLLAASAVTAAINTNKSSDANMAANGSITASDDNVNGSCTPTNHITAGCNDTDSAGGDSGSTRLTNKSNASKNTTLGDAV